MSYQKLINRVSIKYPEAAKYLKNEAINLPSFQPADTLLESFQWRESPQGTLYWQKISKSLGEFF